MRKARDEKQSNDVSKCQRWSPRGRPWPRGRPRGHILKSLTFATKVKSLALASRPQVLENWSVLRLRTALFFELLKFCGDRLKIFSEDLFFGDRLKNVSKDLFFLESTCACVLGLGLEHS